MIKKYRKKPVEVEAIQYTGKNKEEISDFVGRCDSDLFGDLLIKTPEGMMRASAGDYIIKGVVGEFYPCRQDVFESTYEEC